MWISQKFCFWYWNILARCWLTRSIIFYVTGLTMSVTLYSNGLSGLTIFPTNLLHHPPTSTTATCVGILHLISCIWNECCCSLINATSKHKVAPKLEICPYIQALEVGLQFGYLLYTSCFSTFSMARWYRISFPLIRHTSVQQEEEDQG